MLRNREKPSIFQNTIFQNYSFFMLSVPEDSRGQKEQAIAKCKLTWIFSSQPKKQTQVARKVERTSKKN